eukprot:m51a1_g13447 putative protein (543) ;mRNA; r:502-2289
MQVDSEAPAAVLAVVPPEQEPVGHALASIRVDLFAKEFDKCGSVLALLTVLNAVSARGRRLMGWMGDERPLVAPASFVSNRLSQKLFRQLSDPLSLCACAMPRWVRAVSDLCPFVIQFDVRNSLFLASSFGPARALTALKGIVQLTGREREREFNLGRIPRQKVRISRSRVLESAVKVFELGAFKSVLEVEYYGESGSGLGPTLEFYTLVSREVQLASHGLWYTDNRAPTPEGYVVAPAGLYPAPCREAPRQRLEMYQFLGTFCAKAMMDQRLVDLPLSDALLKWMLGQELAVEDVAKVSPSIGRSLLRLAEVARHMASGRATPAQLTVGGCDVRDLDLDFTFPGVPDWELIENGSSVQVTLGNVAEYLALVTRAFFNGGGALESFRKGFELVFSMSSLRVFATADELRSALCGDGGDDDAVWDERVLLEAIKCEHGYTKESAQVQDLVAVMSHDFSREDRRDFVLFLTGSPRLPPGGFPSLSPKFTVVRRADEPADVADRNLPSVNCCFYYLKLPNYSSRAVLRQRLLYAIRNGQGSFHLT